MNSDIVVLIPHFNNLSGLKNSLNSISYPSKIDVLIVDDGSKIRPNQQELEAEFADKLILHVLYNQCNVGIENTLNNGLAYIVEKLSCKYVARLDCGDICHPNRFVKQKTYLDKNEDVYLIGSWVKFFSTDHKKTFTYKAPSDHKNILQNMYIKCSFIHPAVMFRTETLKQVGFYPLDFKAAEDYAFFFNIIRKYKTHIIPEALTYCEINPVGISSTKRTIQLKSKIKVILTHKSISPYFLIGLIRNVILLAIPVKFVTKAKILFFK